MSSKKYCFKLALNVIKQNNLPEWKPNIRLQDVVMRNMCSKELAINTTAVAKERISMYI